MPVERRRRWRWWYALIAAVVLLLIPVAIVAGPILFHTPQGSSGQTDPVEEWPLSVSAEGDDGRTRVLTVRAEEGDLDTSALHAGRRIIVTGSGYDPSRGIYVAICKVPAAGEKPGPCLGGIPEGDGQVAAGSIDYTPSNWINDDWAWKLLGARSYDDLEKGSFTAYLEVGEPVSDVLDCTVDACGIFTRNDHTALTDRVQDLYLPVGFAG
ncbi:hypothetical protein BH09ACT3_BH09ACT3_12260 [soil metagenome]